MFWTLTSINQGVSQRELGCQKGWRHILQESKLQIGGEIGAPQTAPKQLFLITPPNFFHNLQFNWKKKKQGEIFLIN
jgi:hypothetical protein